MDSSFPIHTQTLICTHTGNTHGLSHNHIHTLALTHSYLHCTHTHSHICFTHILSGTPSGSLTHSYLDTFFHHRSHTEIPPPKKKHMLYLPPPWLRLTGLPTNSPAFPVVSWPERKRVTDEVHIDAAKRKCSSPPAPSTASLQLPWRIFQDGELFLSLLG